MNENRTEPSSDTALTRVGSADVLAAVRGIGRREGPHKDQALLLARMIKNGRPASEIQRQLRVMQGDTR